MKSHKFYSVMFFLICISSTSLFTTLAVRNPSQESERSRKRDEWQRPVEVMDALAVKPGNRVADIGCGRGYFTFHLAAHVGAEGKVYAVDIDQEAINKVQERKEHEKFEQVEPILGASADPHLPNDLDVVLIVDTYHEFREYDLMIQAVFRALKPGGRLAIIDGEAPAGRPRTEYHRLHTIPAELVRREVTRHGFVFKESRPGFYDAEYGKKMYFLIFERPLPNASEIVRGQIETADTDMPLLHLRSRTTPNSIATKYSGHSVRSNTRNKSPQMGCLQSKYDGRHTIQSCYKSLTGVAARV